MNAEKARTTCVLKMLLRTTKMPTLKKKQDTEQKRHAILQNYITMYMVLIVYHHMLQRMMLTMFFLTTCVKTHKQHMLCTWTMLTVSLAQPLQCSDCLFEIKITKISAVSECVAVHFKVLEVV